MNISLIKSFFCALLAVVFLPIGAAGSASASVLDLTQFDDAQGHSRLIQEAQKEGSVVVYTSIANALVQKMRADFEKKYGVKVVLWRAGTREVVQRILSEHRAGHPAVDVMNISTIAMEILHREKMLQPVKSSYAPELIPDAIAPHKEWVTTFVNPIVQAYNTNLVKKADLPKTFQDLLDSKWKGRLGIEETDVEWFYAVVTAMGKEKGLKYFRDLVAGNGLSVRNGHSLLNNFIVAGEVPMGISAFGQMAEASKKKGAPIDYVTLEPAFAISFGEGISSSPFHPHAALLFYKYLLTDGQEILSKNGYVPTRKGLDSPFKDASYRMVDVAGLLDEYGTWKDLWDQIVVRQK